jgi:dienelactone hydrolase
MHTPRSLAWPQSYSCHERWVMAYNDRMWFIGTFCFAAGFLLVFSLVTAGGALARNPVPLINQPLVPGAVEPGGAGFILTVNGSGFVSGSVAHWNGSALATTFLSGSQLKASVPASDVAQPGTASVTVVNPSPGGGTSNVVFFEVTSASSSIGFRMLEFGAGQNATWVSVADFNGDGKLDLALADCTTSNDIGILLGNGDGTFQASLNHPVGTCPTSLAVGDFNGDGKLDLAVAHIDSNSLSILLGNGDGTFQAPVNYAVPAGPSSVTIGDFNRDGKLDLAVALFKVNGTATGTDISVLLGNGDGTFQAPMSYTTGKAPISVAVGDFNGDGKLDLAVANYNSNNVSVLLGNGDGTFQAPMSYSTGQTPVLVVVGDFNGDGKLDLAVATSASNNVSVLLGNGDGTFQTVVNYAAGSWPTSVAVGDFNGDGTLDLAVADQVSRSVSLLLGNGDGTFQAPLGYSVGQVPASVAVGDFNGDGRLDVTVLDSSNGAAAVLLQIRADLNIFPDSLSFGAVQVGQSKSLSTTLTNVGSTALSPGITVTGHDIDEFSQVNTCGSSVGAGQSCTISVTFKPTEVGGDSADVSITDNPGGSPRPVQLSGTGCVYNPQRHKCLTTLNSPAVRSALAKPATAVVPSSTGPNSIGSRVLDLVDSRRNDSFLANGTQRELLVRFWYPASSNQACGLAEYTSPKVWNYFSELTELPLPQVTTNSCLDARLAEGAHPVVIFTHGYTGTFTDYTFLFEELASRGYVVASIDHTYEATAVEFPDGRFVKSLVGSHLTNSWRTDDQSLSFVLSVRLDDLRFVLNELERLNTSSDSPFAGNLDLTKIALAGHSLGGLATWKAVQQDARFKAGILLDPYLANASLSPTETPVMMLAMGNEQRSEEECRLWSSLRGPRFSVNLRGAEHLTPSDAVWLARGTIKSGSMGPDKTIAAVRDYIAAFLDANLRGRPMDPLLTGPSAEYPDADVTTQNQLLRCKP